MGDQDWRFWAVVCGITAVLVMVCVPIGRRRSEPERAESGWSDWTEVAAGLSWRDRRALYWANAWGRPPRDPRLAELAMQRGAVAARYARLMESLRVPLPRWLPALWVVAAALTLLQGQFVVCALCLLNLILRPLALKWKAFTVRMAERSALGGS